jgi:hypothetical protein
MGLFCPFLTQVAERAVFSLNGFVWVCFWIEPGERVCRTRFLRGETSTPHGGVPRSIHGPQRQTGLGRERLSEDKPSSSL